MKASSLHPLLPPQPLMLGLSSCLFSLWESGWIGKWAAARQGGGGWGGAKKGKQQGWRVVERRGCQASTVSRAQSG